MYLGKLLINNSLFFYLCLYSFQIYKVFYNNNQLEKHIFINLHLERCCRGTKAWLKLIPVVKNQFNSSLFRQKLYSNDIIP